MKEQVKICIQGGIVKDNTELGTLKVQAVYIIPMLKDSKSRQKKSNQKELKSKKNFNSLFQKAYSEVSGEEITCHTNSYTKDARNIQYNYESKEYKR